MMKFIAALCAAIAIPAVGVLAQQAQAPTPQAPPTQQAPATPQVGTEKVTPAKKAQAANLTEEITATGCIRAWKPAPEDVTKQPEHREPGVAGIFLLTPVVSGPSASNDLPTYLLTPTQVVNFAQHLDDKVEVVGMAQTAPMPPTVQEIASAPPRPENKPNTQAMPRLTIKTLKKVSDSCP
jgi:hypothetical protein